MTKAVEVLLSTAGPRRGQPFRLIQINPNAFRFFQK